MADSPLVIITGERAGLGPARRDLLPRYLRWFNDFEVTRNLHGQGVVTAEEVAVWYERRIGPGFISFTAYERVELSEQHHQGWRPIGFVSLKDVRLEHGTAEYFIVIGEPDARGRGLGTELTRLTLDYAFSALGITNIMLTVAAYNLAGRRAYEKAGFREFGRRCGSIRMGGQPWDEVYMECLAG